MTSSVRSSHMTNANSIHKAIWEKFLRIVKEEVDNKNFQTWFQPITLLGYKDNKMTVEVPSKSFYLSLEKEYLEVLRKAIKNTLGPSGRLYYHIKNNTINTLSQAEKLPSKILNSPTTPLNPNYTFENFIAGDSNKLAKSVAESTANEPGQSHFSPLFISGKVGHGKTHLAQAIVHEIHKKSPNISTTYIACEQFISQFVEALRSNQIQTFINHYLNIDVLVIDDIQFLASKEKTQEVFYRIFNHLHQSGKQIIMTSDTCPSKLTGLQTRLTSRLGWGIIVELRLPDFTTRLAIIENKLHKKNISIKQELMQYVAAKVTTSIRDIEGIINSIIVRTYLNNRQVDKETITDIISRITDSHETKLSMELLEKTTTDYYKVSIEDIKSKSRKYDIVKARQVAMFLIKEYTQHPLQVIADRFNLKDHSTVIYAIKCVNNMLDTDIYFKKSLKELKEIIQQKIQ